MQTKPIPSPEPSKIKRIEIAGRKIPIGPEAYKPRKGVSAKTLIEELKKASKAKIFPLVLNA